MPHPTFHDGRRSIDFVLVYKVSALAKAKRKKRFKTLTIALKALGLQLEMSHFTVNPDIVFVKIHAPDDYVKIYAEIFDINLACQTFQYRPFIRPFLACMETPLTFPNLNSPLYARAPESVSGDIPKTITSAERIMIVHQLLCRVIWGENKSNYGIAKSFREYIHDIGKCSFSYSTFFRLIRSNILLDAYPLHDGNYEFTVSGPLNDRQLLAKFWGSFNCLSRVQPINLVEQYFGTEYAMYFAWLGMYVKYLIPVAILSILVVTYGVATVFTSLNQYSKYVCQSNIVLCPRCVFSQCPMELLKNSCYMANVSYIFDNWFTVIFAGIIALWATVFMEMWQREESVLELQWNLTDLKETIVLRPEFLETTTKKKYSEATDKLEPYFPKIQSACRYTLTFASVIILLFVMLLVTFGVMVYRVTINVVLIRTTTMPLITNKYSAVIASSMGAVMSGLFIFIFKSVYEKLALVLTNMENHRTQQSYHNAYIYKSYALAFANNYTAAFYIAFFKGKFYTYPGDLEQFFYLGGINVDVCDSTGCITDLAILLIIIMIIKASLSNITQVVFPKLQKLFNKAMTKVKNPTLPQWEQEYLLAKTQEFFITEEYMDMVIQYGFVNFFIMGFPLAPVLALINNVIELRVDASKVTKSYRRPIPSRVAGLGAWFGILQAATYIGVFTNALVIAFTSNYMERLLFNFWYGTFHSDVYLNQTFSEFNMEDFAGPDDSLQDKLKIAKSCFYQGRKYPPNHPLKYQHREDYWFNLATKFLIVVIFEHVMVTLKGFVAYAIPDVPFSVRQQVINQEKKQKKAKMVMLNERFLQRVKERSVVPDSEF